MPDTWLGRYSRYVEKLFNVKGGPSIVDVNPSIHAVMQMSNVPVEERYLVGQETFGAGSVQNAVAANKSAAMIRNPLGSGVVVTIEKIFLGSSVNEQVNIVVAGSNPADLANPVANHTRADPRSRSISSCITTQDAPAVDPGTGFLVIEVLFSNTNGMDAIITVNQEIVLLPQIALRIVGQTANQNLLWTILWRERPLESSELS